MLQSEVDHRPLVEQILLLEGEFVDLPVGKQALITDVVDVLIHVSQEQYPGSWHIMAPREILGNLNLITPGGGDGLVDGLYRRVRKDTPYGVAVSMVNLGFERALESLR